MKTTLFYILLFFTAIVFAQTTAIPDANFERALISLGFDSGAVNGSVPTANINSVTFLDVNSKEISDLTGIQDFTALKTLFFYTNSVTNVDLSKNTELESLSTGGNNLTSLDLTKNTKLRQLSVVNNNIESIDLSKNTELVTFGISNNRLSNIDLTKNTKLEILFIGKNDLVNLDLSKNIALRQLTCDLMPNLVDLDLRNGNNNNITSLNLLNNPKLTCILVDNASFSTSIWVGAYDSSSRFIQSKSQCDEVYTSIPDNNFEQALIDLSIDTGDLDGFVNKVAINELTSLRIANKNISDLTGLKDFTALEFLEVNDNNLTTVDLSSNTMLNNLSIYNNSLEALDLSANTLLFRINCDNNKIAGLDLSTNAVLRDLSCQSNQLTSLNVKNGNNHNITFFAVLFGNNLSCIQVDDTDSDNTWASAIQTTLFSENCSATASVVDSVFNNSVVVYPNPVKNTLSVNIKSNQELESVQVFNLLGKKVIEQQSKNIDFNSLTPGMYILKIISKEGKIAAKRVVKQ